MRCSKGSSVIEYTVPLALIGIVVGLTIIYFVTDGTLLNFFKASSNATTDTSAGTMVLNKRIDDGGKLISDYNNSRTIQEGSLGGTPSQPVKKCSDGNCTIDFGDYVLSGIPDNFQEYVESAGTSGGTEKLLTLLEQIADQLEADGDIAGATELRDLANMGHDLAYIEQLVEKGANKCATEDDDQPCFNNYYFETSVNSLEVSGDLTKVNKIMSEYPSLSSHISLGILFENMQPEQREPGTNTPGAQIFEKYDNIMSNDKFSDSIKGITQGLFSDICFLSHSLGVKSDNFSHGMQSNDNYMDPLTNTVKRFTLSASSASDVIDQKAAARTDLDSFLICQAGWNKDTGSKCY